MNNLHAGVLYYHIWAKTGEEAYHKAQEFVRIIGGAERIHQYTSIPQWKLQAKNPLTWPIQLEGELIDQEKGGSIPFRICIYCLMDTNRWMQKLRKDWSI